MALTSNLRRIAAQLDPATKAACKETAQEVQEERDNRVPVDTGDLLSSGRVLAVPGGYEFREGEGLGDARAYWTEFGTDQAPAQPHVAPAAAAVDHPANVRAAVVAVLLRNTV